jgi:heat shock protein HtpX
VLAIRRDRHRRYALTERSAWRRSAQSHRRGSQDLARLRQHADRAINHRRSASVIAAMVLLLAVCSSIVGGADGARRAVTGARPRAHGVSRTDIHRWFGVRLLRAEEWPGLFHVLADICGRAHLSRLPDLYCLPDPNRMNAYALSSPESSTIS